MWFLCILIISVQLCHGILDGMTCSDVGAVKLRLEEEKEKRLLLQNDVEILMLKVANMERKLEKDADGKTERKLEKDAEVISVQLCHGILDGMTCSDVGAVKLRLEEEKEKRLLVQNDVEILMLKVANLEMKLEKDADGSSSKSRNVAFMAYRDTSQRNIGPNQKLVFDNVVTNEGNGYSAITGIFTAPISGIYFFTWMTSHTRPVVYVVSRNTDLVTGIVVNGIYKVHAAIAVQHGFNMGGNSAVFRLNATDIVWIGVSKGNVMDTDAVWYYPTFSGFFVQP